MLAGHRLLLQGDRTACGEWPGGLVGARKHANDPEVDVVGDAESGTPRGQEGSMPFIETAGS
jgi:hypothetical protein